jgi:hypothetical protein
VAQRGPEGQRSRQEVHERCASSMGEDNSLPSVDAHFGIPSFTGFLDYRDSEAKTTTPEKLVERFRNKPLEQAELLQTQSEQHTR